MKELTYSRQEIQSRPKENKCSQCLKTYLLASSLGKHVKNKHSATLHYDQCTQAFAYHGQLKAPKKKHKLGRRNKCAPTTIASEHFPQKQHGTTQRPTMSNNFSVHTVILNYLWNVTWMTIFSSSMLVTGTSPVAILKITIIKCFITCNFPSTLFMLHVLQHTQKIEN